MKTRAFGAGGPQVSEIGLGTWQLGGADWGDVEESEAQAVLRAAADAGIDFLDTADVYGSSMDEALACLEQEGLASLQIIFNVFRQKPIEALFERARARGVALIVRLPLASGLLSGRLGPGTRFPANDHRSYNRDGQRFNVGETFAGLPFERGVELAKALREQLPEGTNLARLALRFCLDHEAVSVVIPGARRVQQVLENAGASERPALEPALHAPAPRVLRARGRLPHPRALLRPAAHLTRRLDPGSRMPEPGIRKNGVLAQTIPWTVLM